MFKLSYTSVQVYSNIISLYFLQGSFSCTVCFYLEFSIKHSVFIVSNAVVRVKSVLVGMLSGPGLTNRTVGIK